MTDLTPEKRAELRHLALHCPFTTAGGICRECQRGVSFCECDTRAKYTAALRNTSVVLSLLDALDEKERELTRSQVVIDSLRELQVELKGAQLMVFEADTAEKRSAAFAVIGNVVAWIMNAERELTAPGEKESP